MNKQTVEMEPGSLPPPAGPPVGGHEDPWYRTRVSRETNGRWFGGVVNGVSKAYGFDVRATRIALAVATLVMPALAVIYVIAWIVLPDTPAQARPLQDLAGGRKRLPLLIVLAGVLVIGGFASLGSWHILGGIPWGVGLIAVGVLLWLAADIRSDAERGAVSAGRVEGAYPSRSSLPASDLYDTTADGTTAYSTDPTVPLGTEPLVMDPLVIGPLIPGVPQATPRERRRRQRQVRRDARRARRKARVPIGLFSVIASLVFLGIGAAGDALDWWDLPILTGTIVVLVLLALGAAVSAVVNRSWRTVPLLIILTWAIGLLSVTVPHLDGGVGERSVRPDSVAQAQTLHELGIGQLDLDLTQVPLAPGEIVHVHAIVGMGQLSVVVPDDVVLDMNLEVGGGAVTFEGNEIASGLRHEEQRVEQPAVAPVTPPPATIQLDLEVGVGHIRIDLAD